MTDHERVIIVGGGVIGVASAYYLARAGADVILLEQQESLVRGASRVNANQLSYSHFYPGFDRSLVWQIPAILAGLNPTVKVSRQSLTDARFWLWGLNFLHFAFGAGFDKAVARLGQLLPLSRQLMDEFVAEHDFDFCFQRNGRLNVFTDPADADHEMTHFQWQEGTARRVSAQECLEIEPLLERRKEKVGGGVFIEVDGVGDCEAFVNGMVAVLKANPRVHIRTGAQVAGLIRDNKRIAGIRLRDGEVIEGGSVLMCAGGWSAPLLASVGVGTPLYPAGGYTLFLDAARQPAQARVSFLDLDQKIVFAPVGNLMKISNGMIFEPRPDGGIDDAFVETIKQRALDIVSELDFTGMTVAHGYRPMTSNFVPCQASTRYENLYVNSGHGQLGWTLALASGKENADLIMQRHESAVSARKRAA